MIDGPAHSSFKAKAKKVAVCVVTVYRRRASHLLVTGEN